ncbi:metal-dependent hydrolase family protein [Streptomyces alfalfae]|uniref:metal-dependent hydrolase family protein n=1 Tax=Streptomyces alfalfae TaxID=1642299 RepID=UPI002812702E|nr:amidohydrolase family protein [Streptomyces alfalfae]
MRPQEAPEKLLRASLVWDGHMPEPIAGIDVRVRGRRITETGASLPPGPDTDVIALPGHTLLPGLIDCHVHVVDEALDTQPLSYQVLSAVPVLRSLLSHGFTTVRDLGGADQPVNVSLKRAVADGLIPGPRMMVAPNMLSARGGHGDKTPHLAGRYGLEIGSLADGCDAVIQAVRTQARAGADWIKAAVSGGFSSPIDTPLDLGFTQGELNALVQAATDRNLPTAAHAFSDEAVRRAISAGVRSIEHACLASAATLRLAADAGIVVVPTQYAQMYYVDRLDDELFWQDRPDSLRATYAQHADALRASLPDVAASGVPIAFGTDAGMFPYEENWREFPTLVTNGFTPRQALGAATTQAAALLRRPDLGHIAPGALADLVAIPGNPFEDIAAMEHTDFVMQDGNVVRGAHSVAAE